MRIFYELSVRVDAEDYHIRCVTKRTALGLAHALAALESQRIPSVRVIQEGLGACTLIRSGPDFAQWPKAAA